MTRRALKPCPWPTCSALTPGGYCNEHGRRRDRARGTPDDRGYGDKWRKTRAKYRAQAPTNPEGVLICENCGKAESQLTGPLHCDHIDGEGPNGPRGHDLTNLQNLCPRCHGMKTRHQTGTAGAPRI